MQSAHVRMVGQLVLKVTLTTVALWLCWNHPLTVDGHTLTVWQVVRGELAQLSGKPFWGWLAGAVVCKGVGIVCAMLRWALLLSHGHFVYPWYRLVATFFIGRFIGTFTPGTLGLDAYKLYDGIAYTKDSGHFVAATLLEKILGLGGLIGTCLLCAPFGMGILGDHPSWLLVWIMLIASGLLLAVLVLVCFPQTWWQWLESIGQPVCTWLGRGLGGWATSLPKGQQPPWARWLTRYHSPILSLGQTFSRMRQQWILALEQYQHTRWKLLLGLLLSVGVHGSTAVVYYCTALAIGAQGAHVGEILFASSLQIVATVLFPLTIAGEGIREAVQALLLGKKMGMAHSILSAALGFWAAESLSFVGAPLWLWRSIRPGTPSQLGSQVPNAQAKVEHGG